MRVQGSEVQVSGCSSRPEHIQKEVKWYPFTMFWVLDSFTTDSKRIPIFVIWLCGT